MGRVKTCRLEPAARARKATLMPAGKTRHSSGRHCTLTVTVALPFSVKVQVFDLVPPLEHAPDHTASRPFEALRVIAVPGANDAEALPPTVTLMPAGLEVTRSPLRPVAVTVRVAGCPGGVTVKVAVRVTPPALAVTVTGADVATALVGIANVTLFAPGATDKLAGTVAADELLLDNDTANPPVGAADVRVSAPCEEVPPMTLVGLTETAASAAGAAGGVTVRVEPRAAPPKVPVIVVGVDAVTDAVLTVNVPLEAPVGIVILPGTVAALVLLLDSVTTAPPVGAGPVKVTVPCEMLPPATLVGLRTTVDSAGAVAAACGVKRRAVDHAPAVPAELTARTRHQCRLAARVGAMSCEAVSV